MILKQIELLNFKNFEGSHTFHFDKVNLISGENGSGKTTLIRDSFTFCVYGYSTVNLEDLATRGKSKSFSVTCHIDNLIITRDFPTKIKIIENGIELEFANNKIAQEWLNSKFKDIDYFRKFRMIDLQQGINILEEGKTSLRKILFSFNEDLFNQIRKNLQVKKRDREIYNRDNLYNEHSHYPSEKRLHALKIGYLNISEELESLEKELGYLERKYYKSNNKKGNLEGSKNIFKTQKNDLIESSSCPTCKRAITEDIKLNLLKEVNSKILNLNEELNSIISDLSDEKEIIEDFKRTRNEFITRKERINKLHSRLLDRLKAKDYKWTDKDVEIIKKAIKELDGFSSYYITEWIQILEPIINDIISKINFKIKFDLDKKGNIDIKLFKDGNEYRYKDLSSGQRLVVSIAFQMALLMERGESGLIIADEGFSNLDNNHLNMIFELFKNLPFQLNCVLHRIEKVPEGVYRINLKKI